MTTRYGFLGVGSIADAMVTGLCSGAEPSNVVLSPRNAQRSRELSRRFATAKVAASNQQVVDVSDVVVVCVRPEHAEAVLSELRFSLDQSVVSAVAGIGHAEVLGWVHPAREVARSIPLRAVASRGSVTPIYPSTDAATALFDILGGSLSVDREPAFEALSAASATVAAHFDHLSAIADWAVAQGVDRATAATYVAELFASLGPELRTPGVDFGELAAAHSTVGGLNEQFARHLQSGGVFDTVREGLDGVLARVLGT